jgi:hypothetical protein
LDSLLGANELVIVMNNCSCDITADMGITGIMGTKVSSVMLPLMSL